MKKDLFSLITAVYRVSGVWVGQVNGTHYNEPATRHAAASNVGDIVKNVKSWRRGPGRKWAGVRFLVTEATIVVAGPIIDLRKRGQ